MTIELPKDLERFVQNEVLAGRYAREADVIRDALTLLKQTGPESAHPHDQKAKRGRPGRKKPLTEAEFDQSLLASGLMSRLPDTDADFDDPDDALIEIQGEPLSETVIRERR